MIFSAGILQIRNGSHLADNIGRLIAYLPEKSCVTRISGNDYRQTFLLGFVLDFLQTFIHTIEKFLEIGCFVGNLRTIQPFCGKQNGFSIGKLPVRNSVLASNS